MGARGKRGGFSMNLWKSRIIPGFHHANRPGAGMLLALGMLLAFGMPCARKKVTLTPIDPLESS